MFPHTDGKNQGQMSCVNSRSIGFSSELLTKKICLSMKTREETTSCRLYKLGHMLILIELFSRSVDRLVRRFPTSFDRSEFIDQISMTNRWLSSKKKIFALLFLHLHLQSEIHEALIKLRRLSGVD